MTFGKFTGSPDKPFHSSIYAEASNGGSMGATSPQGFGHRRHVERNRRSVGRYDDSFVARGNHLQEGLRHRLETDDTSDTEQNSKVRSRWRAPRVYGAREPSTPGPDTPAGSSQKLRVPPRRGSFKEPPQRFNPYQ